MGVVSMTTHSLINKSKTWSQYNSLINLNDYRSRYPRICSYTFYTLLQISPEFQQFLNNCFIQSIAGLSYYKYDLTKSSAFSPNDVELKRAEKPKNVYGAVDKLKWFAFSANSWIVWLNSDWASPKTY